MLQNALGNHLLEKEALLRTETSEEVKANLALELEKGSRYLEKIEKPIKSQSDLDDSLEEWHRLARIRTKLETKNNEHLALWEVLGTDFEVFIDPASLSQAVLALEAISHGEAYQGVLRPSPTLVQESLVHARAQWPHVKNEIASEIEKLDNKDAKNAYLKDIDHEEAGELYADANLEQYEENIGVRIFEKIPKGALEKIQNVLRESQEILLANVSKFLEGRIQEVERQAESLFAKRKGLLEEGKDFENGMGTEDSIRDSIKSSLEYVSREIMSFDSLGVPDAQALNALNGRIQKFQTDADTSIREIESLDSELATYAKNPSKTKNKVIKLDKAIRNFGEKAISPESIQALEQAILWEEKHPGQMDPILHKGQLNAARLLLGNLKNPQTRDEFLEALRNPTSFDALKGEQVLALASHASAVAKPHLENAQLKDAKEAMKAIAVGGTPKQMLDRLENAVGKDHVEYVSHRKFEKEYRKYSQTGYMVYYQQGDFWKVVVDKNRAFGKEGVEFLQAQLAHEMRHLEFENDDRLKNVWADAFLVKLGKANWEAIAQAYVNRFPEKEPPGFKGKGPILPRHWRPKDLLSELYAMGDDLSELPPSVSALVRKGGRLAEFNRNDSIKNAWENSYLTGIKTDAKKRSRWNQICDAFGKSTQSSIVNPKNLSNSDLLAFFYAMDSKDLERNPDLAVKLSEPEVKILGAETGMVKGAKDRDAAGESSGTQEVSKEALADELESLLKIDDKAKGRLQIFEESPYIGHIPGGRAILSKMRNLASDQKSKLKGTEDKSDLEAIKKNIENINNTLGKEDDLDTIRGRLLAVSESLPIVERNPLRRFWKNTSFYSIHDFLSVFEHAKDYLTRWAKKKDGIRKGNLSKMVFDGIHEGLALESSSFISGAWKEAVKDWQERIKSKDAAKLKGYLREQSKLKPPDKAFVQAVINTLVEKGAMNWVNPDLWMCVNNLQSDTYLDPNDEMLYTDPNYLRAKLKKAFGAGPMFNKYAAFNDKDKENTDAHEKSKKQYESVLKSGVIDIGSRLKKLLNESKSEGHTVDAAEYEEMIDSAIHRGVFEPEYAMFYLLAGMATGVLRPNTGLNLVSNYMNEFPVIEFFSSKKSELSRKEMIEKFCIKNFGEDFENNIPGEAFFKFYWTKMVNNVSVQQRMTKASENGGKNWDHDWSRGFAMAANPRAVAKMLKGPSSSAVTVTTQVANMYAGAYQFLDMNSGSEKPTKSAIVQGLGTYFAFETILCGAAFAGEKSYVRKSGIEMDTPPREGGMTRAGEITTGAYEDRLNSMMESVPAIGGLFRIAINKQAAESNPDAHFNECLRYLMENLPAGRRPWAQKTIGKIDDFYSNIGTIVTYLLEPVSEGALASAIHGNLA